MIGRYGKLARHGYSGTATLLRGVLVAAVAWPVGYCLDTAFRGHSLTLDLIGSLLMLAAEAVFVLAPCFLPVVWFQEELARRTWQDQWKAADMRESQAQ